MFLNECISTGTPAVGIIVLGTLFVVILMVILSRVKISKLDQGSGYRLGESFGLIQAFFTLLCPLFLLVIVKENGRLILRTSIKKRSSYICRIIGLPKISTNSA